MPDYDHKNIPTLNDVIEEDQSSEPKQHGRESENTDEEQDTTEENTVETESENSDEPGENIAASVDAVEFHEIASSTEEVQHIATNLLSELENNLASSMQPTADAPVFDPDALQTVVNEVVDKLMPELEQQLKHMIHEALQERLTENSLD